MKLILSGASGRMGKAVTALCAVRSDCDIVAGVDLYPIETSFHVYKNIDDVTESADVVVDFSHPSALPSLLKFCLEKHLPLVLSTTGYSEDDMIKIKEASEKIVIFKTANMSLGINLLFDLVRKASTVLTGYDVEIVEKHHNQKVDAPSGTANILFDAVKDVNKDAYPVYERESVRARRNPNEVGMHSIRGGTIVGEHDVIFAGTNEVITLSHSIENREVFASGALKAAAYIWSLSNEGKTGIYSMRELIQSL